MVNTIVEAIVALGISYVLGVFSGAAVTLVIAGIGNLTKRKKESLENGK